MKPLGMFPCVSLEDDVSTAVRMLFEFRRENNDCNVIIVRKGHELVGLITVRSLFESLEPEAFHVSQWSVPVFWSGLWVERTYKMKKKKICYCFVPTKMVGIQAEQGLMRAVYCFNRTKMPVLAVLEGQSMVGVIEATQIFEEILQAIENNAYF